MTTLREAAQQALEALEWCEPAGTVGRGGIEARKQAVAALRAALTQQAEPAQEPVAWLQPKTVDGYSRPDLGYETCSKDDYGAFPVYRALAQEQAKPVKPLFNATVVDDAHPNGIPLEQWIRQNRPVQRPQTLDEAMQQPRAMAQAYENGYKAGEANERERIIQFLQEMQRVVGDAHNHYGVAAVRIKAGI